jgi:hypothetical protein
MEAVFDAAYEQYLRKGGVDGGNSAPTGTPYEDGDYGSSDDD